jgi:predicted amidophosphoribosyltransferase
VRISGDTKAVVGVCGLYCGACYHYRASYPEGRHLLEEAVRRGRDPEGFTCQGCRSDVLYIHPGCARCEIRACAEGRGVQHCGLCAAFPCQRIEAFQGDGRVHHRDVLAQLERLRTQGVDAWLTEQAQRWTCACGAHFSWYEASCSNCGAPLESYGPDPTVQ